MLDTLSNSYMIATRMDSFVHEARPRGLKADMPRTLPESGILHALVRLYRQWRAASITRNELRELSPRLRQDAGITDDEIAAELTRPFWQDRT